MPYFDQMYFDQKWSIYDAISTLTGRVFRGYIITAAHRLGGLITAQKDRGEVITAQKDRGEITTGV